MIEQPSPEIVADLLQGLSLGSAKKHGKDADPERAPRKTYMYDKSNDLPIYGVIVEWDKKIKYTKNALLKKFKSKLESFTPLPEETNKKSRFAVTTLKRKPIPYLRRMAPNKAVVMFSNGESANEFVKTQDDEFPAFIPMSFVCTVGMAVFRTFNYKLIDVQALFPDEYKVLQWRKTHQSDGKISVSIAIRGSIIPDSIKVKGETIPFELFKRKPIYCTRCLRYGHRTKDCMRKPRCGVCLHTKPALAHREKKCDVIRRKPDNNRCLYCDQKHSIGTEGCIEHTQQRVFKMKLVKHKMDYLSVIEKDILPAVRTTQVNSLRAWLDCPI